MVSQGECPLPSRCRRSPCGTRSKSGRDPQVMDLVLESSVKMMVDKYMGGEYLLDGRKTPRISICPQVVFDSIHNMVREEPR